MVQLGSPRRLETIYRTNLQSAYMQGRWQQMVTNAKAAPWWRYVAILDGRTRPTHKALAGRVFRYDDPLWQTHFPPCGFNCRCRAVALTDRDLARLGIQPESSDGRIVKREVDVGIDKGAVNGPDRTGEVLKTTVTGIKTTLDGKPITMWTDPGFDYSPADAGYPHLDAITRQKLQTVFEALRAIAAPIMNAMYRRVSLKKTWSSS